MTPATYSFAIWLVAIRTGLENAQKFLDQAHRIADDSTDNPVLKEKISEVFAPFHMCVMASRKLL